MNCCPCESHCTQFVKTFRTKREEYRKAAELIPLMKKMEDCDDIVALADIELPAMYLTKTRRWIVLLVFCVLNAISGGPLIMIAVLEPLLIRENVFAGPMQLADISLMFSLIFGASTIAMLPVGIIYDCYGPRWNAVVLTIFFALCALIVGFALAVESLNWLLYIFYPLCMMFSYGGNFGAYGWQWLLPEDQNTVNSVLAAIQALSDTGVLLIVWLYTSYGLQLWSYFWIVAFFALFVAVLNSFITPSQKEHLAYAKAVTPLLIAKALSAAKDAEEVKDLYANYGSNRASGDANCGSSGNSIKPIKTSGWRWWDNLKGVYNCIGNFPGVHFLFIAGCCTLYVALYIPLSQIYPLWLNRLGESATTSLLSALALIYGIGGAICSFGSGRLCDCIGLKWTTLTLILLNIITQLALFIPTYACQIVYIAGMTVVVALITIVAYRFCMLYGPVQLYGTYLGVVMFIMGVFQVVVSAFVSLVQANVGRRSPSDQKHAEIWVTLSLGCFFTIISTMLLGATLLWWQWSPPPEPGAISCRDAGIPEESEYDMHAVQEESEC